MHLQIDKIGELYNTIFPQGFQFVEAEDEAKNVDNRDSFLKGLFNNNRLARRKVIASIGCSVANELLLQGFDVIFDTALDGPDAKDLAEFYLNKLRGKKKFIGIYCPVEERINRLKSRKDNYNLTEEFIRMQTDKWDVFELCKELYEKWFDSSKLNPEEIAKKILE